MVFDIIDTIDHPHFLENDIPFHPPKRVTTTFLDQLAQAVQAPQDGSVPQGAAGPANAVTGPAATTMPAAPASAPGAPTNGAPGNAAAGSAAANPPASASPEGQINPAGIAASLPTPQAVAAAAAQAPTTPETAAQAAVQSLKTNANMTGSISQDTGPTATKMKHNYSNEGADSEAAKVRGIVHHYMTVSDQSLIATTIKNGIKSNYVITSPPPTLDDLEFMRQQLLRLKKAKQCQEGGEMVNTWNGKKHSHDHYGFCAHGNKRTHIDKMIKCDKGSFHIWNQPQFKCRFPYKVDKENHGKVTVGSQETAEMLSVYNSDNMTLTHEEGPHGSILPDAMKHEWARTFLNKQAGNNSQFHEPHDIGTYRCQGHGVFGNGEVIEKTSKTGKKVYEFCPAGTSPILEWSAKYRSSQCSDMTKQDFTQFCCNANGRQICANHASKIHQPPNKDLAHIQEFQNKIMHKSQIDNSLFQKIDESNFF